MLKKIKISLFNFKTTYKDHTRFDYINWLGILYLIIIFIFAYWIIIEFFGFLYFYNEGICYSQRDQLASRDECRYFSLITFATIGYGEYLPITTFSRVLVFLQTLTSFIINPLFASFLAFQLLRKPPKIVLPKRLKIYVDAIIVYYYSDSVVAKNTEILLEIGFF